MGPGQHSSSDCQHCAIWITADVTNSLSKHRKENSIITLPTIFWPAPSLTQQFSICICLIQIYRFLWALCNRLWYSVSKQVIFSADWFGVEGPVLNVALQHGSWRWHTQVLISLGLQHEGCIHYSGAGINCSWLLGDGDVAGNDRFQRSWCEGCDVPAFVYSAFVSMGSRKYLETCHSDRWWYTFCLKE